MLERLYNLLAKAGLPVDQDTQKQLADYAAMLYEWNERVDLTNVPPDEAWLRHYADSLLPLAETPYFKAGASMIDVGSGAGFPGLAIAIARPDMDVCLLDSLRKRCDFLSEVAARLSLSRVRVVHSRAETEAHGALRASFDIASARAVASVRVLAEYLLPFVKEGGHVLCWKGPAVHGELQEAETALRTMGAGTPALHRLGLPDVEHYVLSVPKTKPTHPRYPRKAGTPARKPL